ncbi:MAG: 4-(cytidine 5'-diphospho)-2-C-methyl-D-erythritol kinase [Opitutales bacterium]|nr:4-(cytidine 5'-diphospho)-2-C-methyl-D-erythritol kinase [Opitutales bacterium]
MNEYKEFFCPCKVNYMLSITNPRSDGFHDLVSLVSPVKFYDTLKIKISDNKADTIACNLEGVPLDYSNLVMKAAQLFRQASKKEVYFNFDLVKKVPHGAGLGGGSSNGAIALKAINEMCLSPLSLDELSALAATMGSDCPLFLRNCGVVMRGRGELITELTKEQNDFLQSLQLLIFKPSFSINTGLAYKTMREKKTFYMEKSVAEKNLEKWLKNPTLENLPLYNNMQLAAAEKYPAIEVILNKLREKFGLKCLMSGSGSACFAIINGINTKTLDEIKSQIFSDLGDTCLIVEAK